MSNNSHPTRQTEQYLQLWIYFLPVVGVIPAIWTLAQEKAIADAQNNLFKDSSELLQLKASRLSLNLTLIWLSSYFLFSWIATEGTGIMAFRIMYANAIVTTSYFLACTYFIIRAGRKSLFSTD